MNIDVLINIISALSGGTIIGIYLKYIEHKRNANRMDFAEIVSVLQKELQAEREENAQLRQELNDIKTQFYNNRS